MLYQKKKDNKIWLALFCYWLTLLIWQNVRTAVNRGSLDLLVKGVMLAFLVFIYLLNNRYIKRDILLICIVYLAIIAVSKLPQGIPTTDDLLYYAFPIVMLLLLCGVGGEFTVNKKQLLSLCNCLIVTVSYIVLYALIVHTDSFLYAADVTNAYGNELRSFLASSHEFGLYLAFGMMAILLCMELSEHIGSFLRAVYIITFSVFAISLILTFSRTSIVAFALMLVCYLIFFSKAKTGRQILLISLFVLLTVLLIPSARRYLTEIVFKNNNDAGRGEMLGAGWDIFMRCDLRGKLFGIDRERAQMLLYYRYRHMSFHNAYIQVLVTNGICGIAFFATAIFITVRSICRTLKKHLQWRSLTLLLFAFLGAACFYMMTQTTILFASSIDSYFISLFGIVVPQYVCNAICAGTFGEEPQPETKPVRSKYRRL